MSPRKLEKQTKILKNSKLQIPQDQKRLSNINDKIKSKLAYMSNFNARVSITQPFNTKSQI